MLFFKLSKTKAYLLIFSASWCGPSRKFKEEINAAGISYSLIDVDEAESLVSTFQIESIPTTILLDSKKQILQKWIGYEDKDPGQTQLVNVVKEYKIIPYPYSVGVTFYDNSCVERNHNITNSNSSHSIMSIDELNVYLQSNVKYSLGRFNSPIPFVDKYDAFRRDDAIYCYSAMKELVKQTSGNLNFREWLLSRTKMLMQNEYAETDILIQTYHAVKADGDDLCDEQSVGWYMGVYTYIYCLIHNVYDYEPIFVKNWNVYYSVAFQNKIRGII